MTVTIYHDPDCGTSRNVLGLGDSALGDERLLDAMMAHPILTNRPIVVTGKGVRLCRPSESVLEAPQRGAFSREDGEPVVAASGNRILRSEP
jgi:arsenate reductase